METLLIFTILILIIGFGTTIYFLTRKKQGPQEDDQALRMLQDQIKDIRSTLDTKLTESTRMMQEQFGQSTKVIQGISGQSNKMISEITEKLTKLDDTNKQVIGFAEQLQSLENILKNPKQRGILGEYYLETLLKNIFAPSQYQMQYKFSDGEIVDAVVFLKDQIIPIDSKFSLENQFKQDLKNRIDETAKYIRPQEKTTEFAFMFIPSEGIYYDLLVNQVGTIKVNTRDLIEYAFKEKKVIIVSPTSFYAYLQTVIHGLRKMQIEEQTKEIIKNVELLNKHLVVYEDFLKRLGNNLGTSVNMYNSAYKEFGKIDKDVVRITGKEKSVDPIEIDKPKLDI